MHCGTNRASMIPDDIQSVAGGSRHERPSLAHEPGFVRGNPGAGVTQHFHVIQFHIGDDGQFRVTGVGRIETATQPDFQHHMVAVMPGEQQPGTGHHHLKETRVQLRGQWPKTGQHLLEFLVRQVCAINPESLHDTGEVRAGEQSGAPAVRLQDGCQHAGGAALAVGAAHQHHAPAGVGSAQPVQESVHGVEPRFHAEALQVHEPGELGTHARLSAFFRRRTRGSVEPPDAMPSSSRATERDAPASRIIRAPSRSWCSRSCR